MKNAKLAKIMKIMKNMPSGISGPAGTCVTNGNGSYQGQNFFLYLQNFDTFLKSVKCPLVLYSLRIIPEKIKAIDVIFIRQSQIEN